MRTSFSKPTHLSVEKVLEIHKLAIERFGGSSGIRDHSLLKSAVSAPQATFGGDPPYKDAIEIAAAYLFFLCRNHPFIDGNKRTALGACIIFLKINKLKPKADSPEWESLTLDIAAIQLNREQATERLRALVH